MEAVRNCGPRRAVAASCEPLRCEKPKARRIGTPIFLAVALITAVAASAVIMQTPPAARLANAPQSALAAAIIATEEPSPTSELGALSALEAAQFLASADTVVKVDVSSPQAYAKGHLEDAVTVPVSLLTQSGTVQLLSALPEGFPVLVYASDASDAAAVYALIKAQRADIPAVAYVEDAIDPASFGA